MSQRLLAAVLALALVAPVAACGSADEAQPSEKRHLTVWLMRGTATDAFVIDFEAQFERAHTDLRLDIQIQEWDGITDKVAAALSGGDPPDVIEVGNTQVAQYVASGGVTDLTDRVDDLGGQDWLPGLADPGAIEGRQYGIPFYAANRVVIYRTDLFQQAGLTPPSTRDEWIDVTEELDSDEVQGIYLPGQNWYVLAGFLWDEGGDLAVRDGNRWRGGLNTPEGLAAVDFYQRLQELGDGPVDSDEAEPPQADVFAEGDVAQLIAVPGEAKQITTTNPDLTDKLGYFPIPGKTDGTPGAVFTGGSDLIIPADSPAQDGAYEVVRALTSERWQVQLATTMNYVPNRISLAGSVNSDPGAAAMAEGAANGHATPNSPNWTAVEANNPIKKFLTEVLTGTDPAVAASAADTVITDALNAPL
ncbi:extracellular solute-binding protein [Actinophytocola gossypii]|uniref:Extracellular solute-binding protein n=1 Tax=Actinophytocola gossypii TaxID=2812003 RepID=A0ABT2J9F2_9PSEU|nr:extracellular solute-binding protein [Actinophytocola gossypii]MCT2584403.1 extracellular solute-binding protein [Actinophytocola gossypii]